MVTRAESVTAGHPVLMATFPVGSRSADGLPTGPVEKAVECAVDNAVNNVTEPQLPPSPCSPLQTSKRAMLRESTRTKRTRTGSFSSGQLPSTMGYLLPWTLSGERRFLILADAGRRPGAAVVSLRRGRGGSTPATILRVPGITPRHDAPQFRWQSDPATTGCPFCGFSSCVQILVCAM